MYLSRVYIPRINRNEDRDELLAFMRANSFATVVSDVDGVPVATHLPLVVDASADSISIRGHFAKANDHWQLMERVESLVIFTGPHAYVSPTAYDSVQSVPTWNYVAVHAYGRARIIQDAAELYGVIDELIMHTDPAYASQWNSLAPTFRNGMIGGIVGFELTVVRLQGKYKLSQNKSAEERMRVADTLEVSDDAAARATGTLMRRRERGPR